MSRPIFLQLNTKEDILKNIGNQTADLDSILLLSTVWLLTIFKISSCVFFRRKKPIQAWNILRVKMMPQFLG